MWVGFSSVPCYHATTSLLAPATQNHVPVMCRKRPVRDWAAVDVSGVFGFSCAWFGCGTNSSTGARGFCWSCSRGTAPTVAAAVMRPNKDNIMSRIKAAWRGNQSWLIDHHNHERTGKKAVKKANGNLGPILSRSHVTRPIRSQSTGA